VLLLERNMRRLRLKADGRIVELRDGQEFPLQPALPAAALAEPAILPAVRDLRRRARLTQMEFAARLGVPRNSPSSCSRKAASVLQLIKPQHHLTPMQAVGAMNIVFVGILEFEPRVTSPAALGGRTRLFHQPPATRGRTSRQSAAGSKISIRSIRFSSTA
jgi:hypothetical protein